MHGHGGLSYGIAGSDDCAIHRWSAALMSFVDGRCAGVFEDVHPVVILNFGRYQSVISFEMFGID